MLIYPFLITDIQATWLVVGLIILVVAIAAVRFFLHHILRYLLHGCVVILVIIGILVLLRYFGVI